MNFTADQILGMTARDAEKYFSGGPEEIKRGFKRLVTLWHPDVCADPKADDVFTHIISLRGRVLGVKSRSTDTSRILTSANGHSMRVRPLATHNVDQGEILVNNGTIATLFSPGLADIAARESEVVSSFKFANGEMKDQMTPFLPEVLRSDEMQAGASLVISRKSPSEILLADILQKRGAMPDVHVAWLGSGLLNIAAWMEYAGIVHGAISPHSVLIDPAKHSVRLVAGWGFSTPAGTRPAALPGRTLDVQPRMAIKGVVADSALDLELIRQTLREALGDPRGTSGGVQSLPIAISTWINMPAPVKSFADYQSWQKCLEASWGKRKFIEYKIRSDDIYH